VILPPVLEELVDEVAAAEEKLKDALRELREELGDIGFKTEVFDLSLVEQFDRIFRTLMEQLFATGSDALKDAGHLLVPLFDILDDLPNETDAAIKAIRDFVTAMGDDVPDGVKAAVRAMLGIIDDLERQAERKAAEEPKVDPLAAERKKLARTLRRISQREGEIERELKRLSEGLPGSGVGVTQSVSITSLQANELLSVTRTNMFHNSRTANAAESMQVAILEIACWCSGSRSGSARSTSTNSLGRGWPHDARNGHRRVGQRCRNRAQGDLGRTAP
jgi:hypothetical protein